MRTAVLVLALLAQGAAQSTVRTGVIAGRILNFDGDPAEGVRVAIMAPPAQGVPAALLNSAETDRSGRYRLEEIPPGRYYLAAGPLDAATYFPGVAAIEKAVAVTVVSGVLQEDRDFKLAIPLLRLSGRVIREGDPPGRQSERRDQVGLWGPGIPQGIPIAPTLAPIGPDDTFEFRNLRPGLYQLQVVGDALRMPGVTISLSAQDITRYALNVPRSAVRAVVSVSARVAGGGPLPHFPLRLTPPGSPLYNSGAGAGGRGGPPQQSFTLGSIPFAPENTDSKAGPQAVPEGEYKVVIGMGSGGPGLPEGFSVESVSAGTINLLSENLILAPGDKVQVSVVLKVSSPPPGRKVAGHVIAIAGSGAARIGIAGPISFVAPVGPNGAFEFPHVVPGRYVVQISPNGNSMEGASIVGNLVVARDELTNLQIPAAFPAFKVSGRGTGEAELRRKGRLGGNAVVAILSEQARRGPEPPGFRPGGEEPESQPLAPDGSFQFSGVRPGKYLLTFSGGTGAGAGMGSDIGPFPKAKNLTVVDKDINGLVVKIGPALW